MPVPADLLGRLLRGDRAALARAITLIDRRPLEAAAIDAVLAPHTGRAATVGITGPPGAGKSTLVGSLLKSAVRRDERVAVLALDPMSALTRGAVLGDRLRMEHTTADERVFVRSMTADNGAGGLALATPFAIRALDAAGWPWVLIETVGVGQTEFEIVEAATTTVVVLNPGAGDEVQAVKAGLLEMADIFVINKADREGTQATRLDLERTVNQLPPIGLAAADRRDGGERRPRHGCGLGRDRGASRAPGADRRDGAATAATAAARIAQAGLGPDWRRASTRRSGQPSSRG